MAVANPMKSYRHYKGGRGGRKLLTALLVLVLIGILVFGALFGVVLAGSRDAISGEPQAMIILGCQVMPWGPSILLQDRLNEALTYLEGHPGIPVVASGGQGGDEPSSEAAAMAGYLIARGVSADTVILEEQSSSTWENLLYSLDLLEERGIPADAEIVVVSNGFHLTRVRMLWSRMDGTADNLSTLAAPSSHWPSRLKMYIREPLALVKSFLFDR